MLTVSDTRSARTDESGTLAAGLFRRAGHPVPSRDVVPDLVGSIRSAVRAAVAKRGVGTVFVNGGTGLSRRDRTFEALSPLYAPAMPGFGEAFRALSLRAVGPAAVLSRASAGLIGGKPVFSVPGSPAAVRLALARLVLPLLPHLSHELRKHRHG